MNSGSLSNENITGRQHLDTRNTQLKFSRKRDSRSRSVRGLVRGTSDTRGRRGDNTVPRRFPLSQTAKNKTVQCCLQLGARRSEAKRLAARIKRRAWAILKEIQCLVYICDEVIKVCKRSTCLAFTAPSQDKGFVLNIWYKYFNFFLRGIRIV